MSIRPDITSEDVFFGARPTRRTALRALAAAALVPPGAGSVGARQDPEASRLEPPFAWPDGHTIEPHPTIGLPGAVDQRMTPRVTAASHNNFYEFLPGRGGPVWKHVGAFEVRPWTIEVTGACARPQVFDLDALLAFAHEERACHFRCVERWAMNVPWCGFPLRALLERVEPRTEARFVRFVSAARKDQMPGLREAYYPWPYHEALGMDEAMHELAFVATGVYGKPLLKQHGAPARIVVPWKYGYKNPKSVVRIELVERRPPTFWSQPPYGHEYGFLSNVNPNLPHPRWSQATSHWLDTGEPFPTPLFNGYAAQVAGLYPDEPNEPQAPLRPGQVAR